MMTTSNGNIFRVTGLLCAAFTGHRWIPLTKASDAELWWFFDLSLNKRLSKQSKRRWFETPSRSLWRHCNTQCSRMIVSHWKIYDVITMACVGDISYHDTIWLTKHQQNEIKFHHGIIPSFPHWLHFMPGIRRLDGFVTLLGSVAESLTGCLLYMCQNSLLTKR